jgi:hypothetical protein
VNEKNNSARRRIKKMIAKAVRLGASPASRTLRERTINRAFHEHLKAQGR